MVGGILYVSHQEFNLILFENLVIHGEITYFGVTVFNLATHLGNIQHAFFAEFLEFGERCGFMVTTLVGSLVQVILVTNHIIFQLAHSLEFHTRYLGKCLGSLTQHVFRRIFHGLAVLVEIGAQHGDGRNLGKRIQKSSAETRNHIQVAGTGMDEGGEDVGAVNTLTGGQNLLQIFAVVQHEIQGFQTAVTCHIMEVHHRDFLLLDVLNNVSFRKFFRILFQVVYQRIHAH